MTTGIGIVVVRRVLPRKICYGRAFILILTEYTPPLELAGDTQLDRFSARGSLLGSSVSNDWLVECDSSLTIPRGLLDGLAGAVIKYDYGEKVLVKIFIKYL